MKNTNKPDKSFEPSEEDVQETKERVNKRYDIVLREEDAKKLAVKSRLSPGRKAPINTPDSAKIIAKIPIYPTLFIKAIKLSLWKISIFSFMFKYFTTKI